MAAIVLFIFCFFPKIEHMLCNMHQLHETSNSVANFSHKSLKSVPDNIPLSTTVLDLSYNSIDNVLLSDFKNMANLQSLNLSNNQIKHFDNNVFEFNKYLSYLDLSHNLLENILGNFPKKLNHLDISYNDFETMSVCQGLGHLLYLKYLGLGASRIQKSDFEAIVGLHLQSVFIELQRISNYENGSLLILNTRKLHLFLPNIYKDLLDNVFFDAVKTSRILELSNIRKWNLQKDLNKYISDIARSSQVTHLILNQVDMAWGIFATTLQNIWHSSVEILYLHNLVVRESIFKIDFDYSNTSMKVVFIDKVELTDLLFDQGDLYILFSEMNIENLTINSAEMLYMLCPSSPSTLQSITFFNNALTDDLFQNCVNLTKLKTLQLGQNKLEKLSKVSSMTTNMRSLTYIDVSRNHISYNEEECNWSESIISLNLASNSLTESVFKCLPVNIKSLILKNNEISSIPQKVLHVSHLEELSLSANRLIDLPVCTHFSSLTLVNVEHNQIFYPSAESIQSCQGLKSIKAGHNPFQCNCDLRSFINLQKKSPEKIIGWPDSYVCESPEELKGIKLNTLYVPEIQCNVLLLIPIIVVPTVILIAVIFGLCKYFDVPWFLKMLWQWTRTKHRIKSSNKSDQLLHKDFFFHAFISYSEHDSSWVKNIFLPTIDNGSLRICQHERNFVPGKSIIENIINCIEKSYKSIFILSPNFVQSEWCHYELYFAHHKLYNEHNDNLILILLEPIPQYLIPSRYYKLKALMTQRTYLEWPKERSKHSLFWANLKAAIDVKLPDHNLESSGSELSISQSSIITA
ncbi:toll-like receptor 6 [Bombina bombina]|uniref:toll-like receptor 6 n=1 Tax=Bombina bombina TaxID=8345 RepID=UPI00235A57C8|nr:toll-like receptor 6 [Bombina bombina]